MAAGEGFVDQPNRFVSEYTTIKGEYKRGGRREREEKEREGGEGGEKVRGEGEEWICVWDSSDINIYVG